MHAHSPKKPALPSEYIGFHVIKEILTNFTQRTESKRINHNGGNSNYSLLGAARNNSSRPSHPQSLIHFLATHQFLHTLNDSCTYYCYAFDFSVQVERTDVLTFDQKDLPTTPYF